MDGRIVTLFGEEPQPEGLNAAPRPASGGGEMPAPAASGRDPLAGWVAEKHYYSVGEVAGLFGIKASNIRFWTTEFGLKVRCTKKGDRLYTAANIQTLRRIYYLLRERGFTLAGAKAALQSGEEGCTLAHQTLDLQNALLGFRNTLVNLRNNIR